MSRGLDVESSFHLRVIDPNYLYSSHPYNIHNGGVHKRHYLANIHNRGVHKEPYVVVLWLNANFGTGFRKQKFGEKPGTFDL